MNEAGVRELRARIVRYILVRLLVATGMLIYTGILYLSDYSIDAPADARRLVVLVIGMYAVLGLSASGLAWGRTANPIPYSAYQIVCDTVLITGVVFTFGGVQSPFALLYAIAVVGGAWLDYRRGAILAAVCNAVALLFVAAVLADDSDRNTAAVVSTNILGFFLVALLSGELAQRVRRAGEELALATGRAEALASDLSQVLESIRSGLALVDTDGRLRSANRVARELFPDLDAEVVADVVPGYDESDDRVWEVRVGADTNRRDILLTRSTVGEQSVLTMEDITDLRAMQLRVAREERLAAVGRLSAGIAHEIRNPLTSLSGAIQLLDLSSGDERLRSIIGREVDRLNRLVTDFMHAGSPPELRRIDTDVNGLIGDVVDAFRADPRYADNVVVAFEPRPLDPLFLDRDQVKTVLWNLLLNAAQHMPRGGAIQVGAERIGDRVRMLVTDEGTGIAEEDLDSIFDPFFTRRAGGTGLGLATVERVARQHGGDVWVHSTLGKGTTFGIWLPARAEEQEKAGG
ncbi:MAG: PAS domain-containing protein [Proteobacteria bacterium]|nr:PAS domain-containing protein [Pseudomonadota bacterium]MCP4919593.1 PAS domain-containing protein [Pseudomonadota bacterium]